jgi:MOSC domain-containing protein YiiM
LCIGDARIRLHGETRPCHIMDEQHDGLRRALEPDCRGGVFGQVLAGGVIRAGDRVEVM